MCGQIMFKLMMKIYKDFVLNKIHNFCRTSVHSTQSETFPPLHKNFLRLHTFSNCLYLHIYKELQLIRQQFPSSLSL